jgi:hypothetical protein
MPGMVTKDEEEKMLAASTALATREYRRGLQDGLNVAEQIRSWLTGTPPKRDVLKWAETVIQQAKDREGL